jgi:hypothetical protein
MKDVYRLGVVLLAEFRIAGGAAALFAVVDDVA